MIYDCDYHNEDSFKHKISSCDGAISSILHQNVRSIVNKHKDFVNFSATLRYEFLVISVTEMWLTKHNMMNFQFNGIILLDKLEIINMGVELEYMLISHTN